jgi:hypothetical protein
VFKKVVVGLMAIVLMAGCNDADVVSHNLSQEADKFNILRRVVFYNGITEGYMLSIEGYCSLGNDRTATEISVTCKTGPDEFKKHFLGLSDNVTYFIEQLEGENVSVDHYKVVFKPTTIVPDIEVR